MRLRPIPLFPLLVVFPLAVAFAQGDVVEPPADCTFNPQAFHSPRQVWRDASRNAELVAPSIRGDSAAGGRRHASNPPALGFTPRNFIDTEIFGKMMHDGVVWTSRAGDEEFLRRVSLDLTGQIPDPATVKAFLADPGADKRDRMIDTLLASDGFTDRWTMWFGDLVQNVQVASNTNENYQARNAYYAFIHSSFAANKPYDQMVRELISGSGGGFTNGEADYWVRQIQGNGPIQDTYDNLSAQTGQQFLGMYFQCLSCHGGFAHLEQVNTWLVKKSRYDFWKNAAFFAQVATQARKDPATNNTEIVLSENKGGSYKLNTNSGNKTPRIAPTGQPAVVDPAFMLTGETPQSGENRRDAYSRMLTAHPQFARATVNYVWKSIFGVGIVEPANSFDLNRQDPATLAPGVTLQPTHPALLNQLADSFVASGYNFRTLVKTIIISNTYQLSSRYTPGAWSEAWTSYYARHYPQRLMAEAMLDAILKATGVGASISVTGLPTPFPRAMMLPDTTEGGGYRTFLNNFGRGNRDDEMRTSDGSIVEALTLLNDPIVVNRTRSTTTGSTTQKLKGVTDPASIADTLYLTTLSRYPSAAERQAAITYLKSGDLVMKTEDLQFALLNKLEFLFN
jgi:hypothetical protein